VAIIFIGNEFKYRKFLQNYILNKHKADRIYFFDNVDFGIENIIEGFDEVLVVANEKSYSTMAKILATLTDDTLMVRNDILMPSNTLLYEKNSFLISYKEKTINLIKVADFIPNILLSQKRWTLHVFNYDKETVELFLKPVFESFGIKWSAFTNEGGWVEVCVSKLNNNILKQLKGFVPNIVVAENIFEFLKNKLEQRFQKITFAESCTGGLVASYLTKVPGSSEVFDGSVVSYANKIKNEWLGVDERVLERFGAVSEECVEQMLLGALELSDSDYAVAISGIAGPSGGSKTKPIGTVFVGVSDKNGSFVVERLQLKGDREQVQYQATLNAVRIVLNFAKLL
jgi:nicotinamide-nucleotide amidase